MYCVDTDIAIEFLRGNPVIRNKFLVPPGNITITPITALELYYGAYRSSKVAQRLEEVKSFLDRVAILEFNSVSYNYFGKIKKELQEKGNMIDGFDLAIACLCLAHGKILVTNNTRHFERIEGLKLLNWM